MLLGTAAMGRPCIVFEINGSKDATDDGITGYLFETRITEDLTDKVISFVKLNHKDKVKMGLAGRTMTENELDR